MILKIDISYKKALAHPVIHALTGCDAVFKSTGKKDSLARGSSFDDITGVFLDLSSGTITVSSNKAELLERFVILLHEKTHTKTSINQLIKEFSTKGCSIE